MNLALYLKENSRVSWTEFWHDSIKMGMHSSKHYIMRIDHLDGFGRSGSLLGFGFGYLDILLYQGQFANTYISILD